MASPMLGSNINLVKAHNMQALLLSLLYEDNLSRVQLAKKLQLSNTTITNLISELISLGLVTDSDCQDSTKTGIRPVGRPRTGVCLQPNAHYVIGIHIGVGIFRLAITNLRDEIIIDNVQHFDVDTPAMQVLELMGKSVKLILEESQISQDSILGVGVGASGLVDFQTGNNVFVPNLNWRDIPIKAYLEEQLDFKVVVDNNVRTMALAESYFGAGRSVDSLVFVYGRIGVGAGFIYKGQIFRGSAMGAGEIGHTNFLLEDGEPCRCGKRGCLETLVSESVILKETEKILGANPDGILAQMVNATPGSDKMDLIFKAARQGDATIRKMLEERAYFLGIALANMVNLYNPELIILGGIFSEGEDIFLPPLKQTIERMAFANLGTRVRIQATSFGWKAGVCGAAALALTHFFYHIE